MRLLYINKPLYLMVTRGGRYINDAGSLLALQVGDESGRQVGGLLKHVHVVAATG